MYSYVTAHEYAIYCQHLLVYKLLFEVIQSISIQHYASRNNHLSICELLLRSGADVNSITKSGVTPLHRAAYKGNTEIVQLLLRRGACPTIQDSDGKIPLHKV